MHKKLLIPISHEEDNLGNLRFVSSFMHDKESTHMTLLHIARNPAAGASDEEFGKEGAFIARQRISLHSSGEKLLQQARKRLLEDGFTPENVKTKFMFRQFGTVKDIIQEGVNGQFDAVALGHRGQTIIDALQRDSVSQAMVDTRLPVPLWICRWPEEGRRDVLLCTDGSEASAWITDHVGFMLATAHQHRVYLLHVHNPAKATPFEADDILGSAREILRENGMPSDRILEIRRRGVAYVKIIKEEAERSRCAAVAVGRTGADMSFFRRMFIGSVTMSLLKGLNKMSLWVSH